MSKLKQSLKITIKASAFADKMNAKLEEVRKNAKLPGFRPGQAPMAMIRKKYEAAVKGEVLDDLINQEVAKAIKEKGVRPAMRPAIKMDKFEDGKDIELSVDFEALPEVKVKAFNGVKIEKMVAEATDKEIQDSLGEGVT